VDSDDLLLFHPEIIKKIDTPKIQENYDYVRICAPIVLFLTTL